jgi:hypothetical protein
MATGPAIIGTPHYSLDEASNQAKKALAENYAADPWEAFAIKNNEDVRSVYNKVHCVSRDKVPIFITRATAVLPFSADKLFATVWEPTLALKWNVSTVSSISVVSQSSNSQRLYEQHKTLSAASARRDCVYDRAYEKRGDGSYWIFATSVEDSSRAESKDFVRSWIVFSGIEIKPMAGGKSEITSIWCLDFGGWLHVKFIEAEFSNVALRLSRIGRNVPTGPVQAVPAPQPVQFQRPTPVNASKDDPSKCPSCGTPKSDSGKYCGGCGELLSNTLQSIV